MNQYYQELPQTIADSNKTFMPNQVIMNQATHLYLDHPYEPDPEERGLYWATRFTDTHKVFGFSPNNVYACASMEEMAETGAVGNPCSSLEECEPLRERENIEGSA